MILKRIKIVGRDKLKCSNMKNENAIDLMKFIMSLLIVAIHVPILTGNLNFYDSLISNGIARVGVPFYFITGSYFLFRKIESDNARHTYKKYFLKLFRIYCIWSFIYLLPILFIAIYKDPSRVIYRIPIFIKDFLFSGLYYHLWYLNATIVCTILFILLVGRKRYRPILLPLSIVLYVCGLLCGAYYIVIANHTSELIWLNYLQDLISRYTYSTSFSFPLFWMIFIYLGYRLATARIYINRYISGICLIVSIVLIYCELFFIDSTDLCRSHSMMISIVPASCFLFIWAKSISLPNLGGVYPFLRHLSTLIYLVHPLVWLIISSIYRYLGIVNDVSFLSYMLVLTISIFCAVLIIISSKSSNRNIQKLSLLYR